MTTSDLQFHEAANIFPLDDEHLDDLAADIRAHGQLVSIQLLDGKILDGRRRYMACRIAGIAPKTETVCVDDPVSHVLSLNKHRRHLTPSQLAMVADRAREIYDRQAKERQKRKPAGSVQENLPEQSGQARDAAGKALGVSGRLVDHAAKVRKHGTPELVKAVDEGRMAVSTAAVLATEPEEVQQETLKSGRHNRRYGPGPGATRVKPGEACEPDDADDEPEPEFEPGKLRGVGVLRANEAINCLIRIPKNDPLRKRGFQIVTDWIRHNP